MGLHFFNIRPAVLVCIVLVGCATQEKVANRPDVLSGEAPVADVVAAADDAARMGNFQAAEILYRQALSREPSADVWYRTGLMFMRMSERERAVWAFENALWMFPDHEKALARLALHYTAHADSARATVYLDQLLALNPRHWQAHNAMGILADLDGRFGDAVNHYRSALETNPDSSMLWNNLGYSRYLLGDYSGAVPHLKRALELDPGYEIARRNLALVHVREEKYELALAVLLSAEDEVDAHTYIGQIAYQMQRYAIAESFLETAIQRSPFYQSGAVATLFAVKNALSGERRDTSSHR